LNADQAAAALPGLELFRFKDEDGPEAAFRGALANAGDDSLRRLAIDPEMRAEAALEIRDRLPGVELVSGAMLMRRLREVKQPDEIQAIQRSAGTADRAMEAAIAACRPGASEAAVAAAAIAAFRDAGAKEPWVSVGSGPNGAFPHHEVSRRLLQAGEPVLIDLGAKLEQYHSDLTRMVHVGEPSSRYDEVHRTVEQAVQAALAAAHVGATCGDVDAAARGVIAAAGYGERFLHRTGHGLGLSVHEPPWIMAREQYPIRSGMVFSIEPGIYLPSEFGVRLEEIVVITDTGPRIVSKLDRSVEVVTV
jgi:Xaa-Pro aminopeptidase